MNEDDGEFDCNVSGTMGSAANMKLDRGYDDREHRKQRNTQQEIERSNDSKGIKSPKPTHSPRSTNTAKEIAESDLLQEPQGTSSTYIQIDNSERANTGQKERESTDRRLQQKRNSHDLDEKSHE